MSKTDDINTLLYWLCVLLEGHQQLPMLLKCLKRIEEADSE